MTLKIFNWSAMNNKQKTDIALGNSLFAIFTTISIALYIFSINFRQPIVLLAAIVTFFAGVFIVWRFLKKAKKAEGGGAVFADFNQRLEENLQKRKQKKEKEKPKGFNFELYE
jgi:uncharacterized membrane protein YobD (UPF0266 family)